MTQPSSTFNLGDRAERPNGLAYFLVSSPSWDLGNLTLQESGRKKPDLYEEINPYRPFLEKRLFSSSPLLRGEILNFTHEPTSRYGDNLFDYSSLFKQIPDDMQASIDRYVALPVGQIMAVISFADGVYRVEQGYIPGRSPRATMGTSRDLSRFKRPVSLQTVVEEAQAFEAEVGAPVVIRPSPLDKMHGTVIYPPNGYDSVSLYALDRPLEDRIS